MPVTGPDRHNGCAPSQAALRPQVTYAPRKARATETQWPSWLRALLSVPLLGKLVGANGLIVVVSAAVALAVHGEGVEEQQMLGVIIVTLVASLLVNLALVYVALRPLQALEETAERVWRGDLDARVPASPLADRDMARVGKMFNLLLDGLLSDRSRMRALASQVISAQDRERARIARELHDSTAQTLTALTLQASAALRDSRSPQSTEQFELIRDLAVDAMEEVRTLSHSIHPRVLDDLGLPAALEWLARSMREQEAVATTVQTNGDTTVLRQDVGSVLYRVAQEALANAVRHGAARTVRIKLTAEGDQATLEVEDDGTGFDLEQAERRRPGLGLFTMRERVALFDGTLEIVTAPGAGTRAVATVPLKPLNQP